MGLIGLEMINTQHMLNIIMESNSIRNTISNYSIILKNHNTIMNHIGKYNYKKFVEIYISDSSSQIVYANLQADFFTSEKQLELGLEPNFCDMEVRCIPVDMGVRSIPALIEDIVLELGLERDFCNLGENDCIMDMVIEIQGDKVSLSFIVHLGLLQHSIRDAFILGHDYGMSISSLDLISHIKSCTS